MTTNFGWLFSLLAIVVVAFMLVVGYGRTGAIRLGADDESPEFSTVSWIAMLFSAGMGIGLLFFGPAEPLGYFNDVPPGFTSKAGTPDAMLDALAQSILHWGPMAWAFYALVGGAIAYAAYRRGRAPLISAIFRPIFGERTEGWLGAVIDVFAIIVTLFGTGVTLGIGALQISRGVEVVSGLGPLGNNALIVIITVLTAAFVVSAVSGIKRGIRILSNINMVLAGLLALFVFIAGPTLFLLNMIPASVSTFFGDLWLMLSRNASQGEASAEFVSTWTNYYWAWWISWTPFVGMFIAKISRGRTLREFVTVIIVVPSTVCIVWFGILGGAAMYFDSKDGSISGVGSSEGVLFALFEHLPFGIVLSVIAMLSIVLFFVTSADSAAIVMGSMSQRGKPEPATWVTLTWGVLLGAAALALLLAGGESALSGLQSMMVVSALPFAFIVIGIMISWAKELATDPYMLRQRYARAAIAQGVRRGIAEHGDDFVFGATEVDAAEGAGASIDSDDPALTEWYEAATGQMPIVTAEDVTRTLDPGRIQRAGPHDPTHTASGDASLTVGEDRRSLRRQRREGQSPEPTRIDADPTRDAGPSGTEPDDTVGR
ncbi:High-affinity choline uptake protein BetT [Microbacterium esteraromaticum]|uniref:High-affinity choline uptake protein BetT n=1 Tax=Microbacterium esteraromaticum TaxID=57043 RepID=A0A1R4IPY8_9MICO|nr:BCCT family transporter [Microbacterium esteraromaticum]SJN21665.1 High-affinity choline uptake protein BetT [Microbacterium esteraromaticum]